MWFRSFFHEQTVLNKALAMLSNFDYIWMCFRFLLLKLCTVGMVQVIVHRNWTDSVFRLNIWKAAAFHSSQFVQLTVHINSLEYLNYYASWNWNIFFSSKSNSFWSLWHRQVWKWFLLIPLTDQRLKVRKMIIFIVKAVLNSKILSIIFWTLFHWIFLFRLSLVSLMNYIIIK